MRMTEQTLVQDAMINSNVSRAVKILITANETTQAKVCLDIGMKRSTMMRRLNGHSDWTAAEVSRLASYFGVPVGALMGGRAALLGSSPTNARHDGPEDQYASFIDPSDGVSRAGVSLEDLIPQQQVAA